jgi:hypothetical protein
MGFADALKKGLDAHSRAVAARREMAAILEEASGELSALLQTEVAIRFTVSKRSFAQQLAEVITGVRERTYNVDVIEFQKAGHRFKHIADVEFAEFGYPVQVKWDAQLALASNAAEFRAVIENLLSNRSTGEKIAWVLEGKERTPPAADAPEQTEEQDAEQGSKD